MTLDWLRRRERVVSARSLTESLTLADAYDPGILPGDWAFLDRCQQLWSPVMDAASFGSGPSILAYTLPDCVVLATGVVIAKSGQVIRESFATKYRASRYCPPIWKPRMLARTGRVLPLLSPHPPNLYHWLVETLPRAMSLDFLRTEIDALLVRTPQSAFESTCLERLRESYDVDIRFIDQGAVRAAAAVVVDLGAREKCGAIHPRVADWTRNLLLTAGLSDASSCNRRIYISRAKCTRRRLLNETEVESLLHKEGFVTVFTEELPFPEQVALFAGASHIVGVHGAGLAHLVFARRTKVCILQNAAILMPHFVLMARSLGHQVTSLDWPSDAPDQDFAAQIEELGKCIHGQ